MLQYIVKNTQLAEQSVRNTLELLNQDCTIPFIARYRKEKTANLDEVEIEKIVTYKIQFEELEKRKKTILKALYEQDVLTTKIEEQVIATQNMRMLEDLYLPFKRKRKTKAEVARKNGLESLAKIIMSQKVNDLGQVTQKYITSTVPNEQEALEGARNIIAEWVNERTSIRNDIRRQFEKYTTISTKVVKSKSTEEKAQKFKDYFDWEESLNRCPSHRLLAMLRGHKEGYLRLSLIIDDEQAISQMERRIITTSGACSSQISMAIADAYKRLLFPSLSTERLNLAKEKSDEAAIKVFAKNLSQLLLGAPLGEKNIMGIDPGYRTGCKVVCLDAQGALKHNETIYPHAPKNDTIGAMKKISSLVDAYKIEAIAIGNGTASRETEQLIRKMRFHKDIQIFVVSEAGASIYSASKIAREEFPNYDVTVRGAVSIGRRLADPLAELVKIEPKSIGVGQYQHDVDQHKLQQSLDVIVERCVNNVGVNVNTASKSLLSYVSGIGPKLAENIVAYRTENGIFHSRKDLKKVSRFGEKVFEQSAGFLRINNAKNPLDNSSVHPESYAIVKTIAKDVGKSIVELVGEKEVLETLDLNKYTSDKIGLITLKDIVSELKKTGLDPRAQAKVFTFNQSIQTISDVREGQLLPGIINNITNFGCFVDIGIKESGLVHVSNLSDQYVSDINDIVHLHQQVIVKVLEVDVHRKRIQLSMNYDSSKN